MKTTPQPLTKEEMDKLLAVVSSNSYYNLLFQLARVTGRRLGEFYGVERKEKIGEKIVGEKKAYSNEGNEIKVPVKRFIFKSTGKFDYGLQVKDIEFQNDGTAIMKTWVLKRRNYTQDETTVPSEVAILLKRYIREKNLKLEDYVFRTKTYRTIQMAVTSYAKKAGINKNVSFHTFRHYFITHLLKKGWSHNQIAKVTGHKSVQSIGSYDHVVSRDLKERVLEDLKGI